MRAFFAVFIFVFASTTSAHPGGGIIALSENSALVADPTENFIWLVEKGQEPKRLVKAFHAHWMTRGLDGNIYTEAFGESGGAWSSAAFRLELPSGKVTEMAHRDEVKASVFAVDRDGAMVFQRGAILVSWRKSKETAFRPAKSQLQLKEVTAYFWEREDDLILADRNRVYRMDGQGVMTLLGEIDGKVLEPRIWNGTETPIVFGLAIEESGAVLATVPSLAKVFRIEKNKVTEFASGENGWRSTGISVFGDSLFLMESDSKASTSPRIRILRGSGQNEIITLPPPSR